MEDAFQLEPHFFTKGTAGYSWCAPVVTKSDDSHETFMRFCAGENVEGTSHSTTDVRIPMAMLDEGIKDPSFFTYRPVTGAKADKRLKGTGKTHLYEVTFKGPGGKDVTVDFASGSSNARDAYRTDFFSVLNRANADRNLTTFAHVMEALLTSRGDLNELAGKLADFRREFSQLDRYAGDHFQPGNPKRYDELSGQLDDADKNTADLKALVEQIDVPARQLYMIIERHRRYVRNGWRRRDALLRSDMIKLKGISIKVPDLINTEVHLYVTAGVMFFGAIGWAFAVMAALGSTGIGAPIAAVVALLAVIGSIVYLFILHSKLKEQAKELADWYDDTSKQFTELNTSLKDGIEKVGPVIEQFNEDRRAVLDILKDQLPDASAVSDMATLGVEYDRLATYYEVVEAAEAEVYEQLVKRPPDGLASTVRSALHNAGYDQVKGAEASRQHKAYIGHKIAFSTALRRFVVLADELENQTSGYEWEVLFAATKAAAPHLSPEERRGIALLTFAHHARDDAALDYLFARPADVWRAYEIFDLTPEDQAALREAVAKNGPRIAA